MLQFRAIKGLGLIALLAATLVGCTIGEEPTDETASSPTASPSPAASPAAKPTPGKAGKAPDKNEEEKKPAPTRTAAALVQPTNPDVRAAQVRKGRNDPFTVIPIKPPRKPAEPKPEATPKPPTKVPTLPNSGQGGRPTQPSKPVLPPLPDPTLAKSVEVTGVIQVGNSYQIIVKAPEETTPRYVRVGQRLSNGQVLVKRVEGNFGGDPVVILEEQGVEVARRVGEPAAPAPTAPSPSTT